MAVPNLTALGAAFVNPFRYLQNKFTEKDDLTWIKGSHTLHIGGMFQRQQAQSLRPGLLERVLHIPGRRSKFPAGNPFLFEGAPNGGTNSYRAERYDAVQPYIQDDWKVNSRLTINFGLRYDWETNPIEIHNLFTNVVGPPFQPNFVSVPHAYQNNPSNRNFDPRVGLAWDVFGDHKTLVAPVSEFSTTRTPPTLSRPPTCPTRRMTRRSKSSPRGWPYPFVGGGIPSL